MLSAPETSRIHCCMYVATDEILRLLTKQDQNYLTVIRPKYRKKHKLHITSQVIGWKDTKQGVAGFLHTQTGNTKHQSLFTCREIPLPSHLFEIPLSLSTYVLSKNYWSNTSSEHQSRIYLYQTLRHNSNLQSVVLSQAFCLAIFFCDNCLALNVTPFSLLVFFFLLKQGPNANSLQGYTSIFSLPFGKHKGPSQCY